MNDIGAMLSEARINQNLEIEQVSRETNIARDYIKALENDDYTAFPAEPYVLGFLRNYAEYLGLDADEIVNLYKQIKIQESSLPTEALLPKRNFAISKTAVIAIVSLIGIVCVFVIAYFAFTKWIPASKSAKPSKPTEVKTQKVVESRQSASYKLTEEPFEKRIFEGDELKLIVAEKEYSLKVLKASPDLVLETAIGNQIISLGQNLKFDLNNDLIFDVEFTVEDIDKKNPENGALISVLTGSAIQDGKKENQGDVVVSPEADEKISNSNKYIVLFESSSAYPVTLNATFRGYCLFRFVADKTNREERYYQKAEQLTVQANNGLRIWASNGNVVKLQLVAGGKTVDLDVSRPGEIIVKDLKWIRDDVTKRFKFIAIDVD